MTPEIVAAATKAAEICGLDPLLVQAIIQIESAGNPWVCRYEPMFRYLYFPREHADRLNQSVETEAQQQMTSWGTMQIMGAVAREIGFNEPLAKLADLETGLTWSCKKLKQIKERWGDDEVRMIASWNAGSPRKTVGGLFTNQRYVDSVWSTLRSLRQEDTHSPTS